VLKFPADEDAAGPVPDPLAVLQSEHVLQLELCACLEHLADSLPDQVDRRLAHALGLMLANDITGHFAWEEQVLFPALRRHAASLAPIGPMLAQLESEHDRDEDHAKELAETLAALASQGRHGNPEMLGYMLRGFFEGQRRHISWEESVLVPMARSLLGEEELRQLATPSALAERIARVRSAARRLRRR
jgi:hemerythrin-like domain-containing protein